MPKHLSETRTESMTIDLLKVQGWNIGRPPKGALVRQNEYKSFTHLDRLFKGQGKKGKGGDAFPDFLLMDSDTQVPLLVVEAKADIAELGNLCTGMRFS